MHNILQHTIALAAVVLLWLGWRLLIYAIESNQYQRKVKQWFNTPHATDFPYKKPKFF